MNDIPPKPLRTKFGLLFVVWALLPVATTVLTLCFGITYQFSARDEMIEYFFPRFLENSRVIADRHGMDSASFYYDVSSSLTTFLFAMSFVAVISSIISPRKYMLAGDLMGRDRQDIGIIAFFFGLAIHLLTYNTHLTRVIHLDLSQDSFSTYVLFFREYTLLVVILFHIGAGLIFMLSYWLRRDLK